MGCTASAIHRGWSCRGSLYSARPDDLSLLVTRSIPRQIPIRLEGRSPLWTFAEGCLANRVCGEVAVEKRAAGATGVHLVALRLCIWSRCARVSLVHVWCIAAGAHLAPVTYTLEYPPSVSLSPPRTLRGVGVYGSGPVRWPRPKAKRQLQPPGVSCGRGEARLGEGSYLHPTPSALCPVPTGAPPLAGGPQKLSVCAAWWPRLTSLVPNFCLGFSGSL